MGNLIFNVNIIEILHYNVDGKGSFIYLGDGRIYIAPKENLDDIFTYTHIFEVDKSYFRDIKLDKLLDK